MPRTDSEEKVALDLLYHLNSKNRELDVRYKRAYQIHFSPHVMRLMAASGGKRYMSGERLPLPAPRLTNEQSLASVLLRRRSGRTYTADAVNLDVLATVLGLSNGIHQREGSGPVSLRRRFVPTSGGLGAVELYVIANRVLDLASGIYHYGAEDHCLTRLPQPMPNSDAISEAIFQDEFVHAPALVVVSADLGRLREKYGERAYRLVHLDAGHVGQNICLVATHEDLACCPSAGYVDERLEQLIGIDGVNEIVLYLFAIG